ncbi:MAG TPA: hypothetical protein VFP26_10550 [Gemmatimonadaceae bacterium]|nr:hypothetical protein [Gemmatimonadaceae bacterium]
MDVDWSTSDQASQCVGFGGTDRYYHATRWEGLSQLTPSQYFTFGPITSHHDGIYYARPDVDILVQKTAKSYSRAFNATKPLFVTAASLIYGGLEDTGNNWSMPHQLHRIGADVDFDGSADNHKVWDPIMDHARRAGFRKCEPHNGNHVHCYTTQYNNPNLH